MSNELFQKVVDTALVAGGEGGILNPEQANRFIDYMWDETVLGQTVRQIRMNAPVREIDKMDLGARIARHATEGVDDGINASPTFSKITLTTEKIRLDWELTSEALEDNIEQANLEDHIARLMATQLGNDLEDLAINGDTDISPSEDGYALLKAFDGYRKRSLEGATVIDALGDTVNTSLFNRAYKALPRKFKARRDQLRFFTSSGLVQDYHEFLALLGVQNEAFAQIIQPGNPVIQPGGPNKGLSPLRPFGIPLFEVPLYADDETGTYDAGDAATPTGLSQSDPTEEYHGHIELTHPDNRLWGIKREIKVYRKFAEKKDAVEFTVFTRQGVQIDNLDAYVVVNNVRNKAF
jgi:hypothetical protein